MIGMFDYTSTQLSVMESVSVIQMLVVTVGCNGQLQLTQQNHAKLLSTRTWNKQFKTMCMSCDQHADDTRRTRLMASVCRSPLFPKNVQWQCRGTTNAFVSIQPQWRSCWSGSTHVVGLTASWHH